MDLSTLVQYSDLTGPKNYQPVSWVTEDGEVTAGICVSRTLLPDRDEDVPLRVINDTKNPVFVKAGTVISDLDSAKICSKQSDSTRARTTLNSIRHGGQCG